MGARYILLRWMIRRRTKLTHDRFEPVRGTLDLLVLEALSAEPMHGCGISQRIQQLAWIGGLYENGLGNP